MIQAQTMFTDFNVGFKALIEKANKMFKINTDVTSMKIQQIS
jgi:hypothetical protein